MDVNRFICFAHSGLRWLVVLAAVVALVWLVLALAQRRPFEGTTRRILAAWGGVLGLQWLIGVVYMIAWGVFAPYQWTHALLMTGALAAAHGHYALKRRPDNARLLAALIGLVVALALVYIGVTVVPAGWTNPTCPAWRGA
jgi:predicted permease